MIFCIVYNAQFKCVGDYQDSRILDLDKTWKELKKLISPKRKEK
jgi:hypothetical protein